MALTQDDRISISGVMSAAPAAILQIEANKVAIEASRVAIQKRDTANKGLVDKVNLLIDPYQTEIGLKDGGLRSQLTETVQDNAADRKVGNFLFPNEPTVPLPSIPDGMWKNFPPFMLSYGIGKQKLEVYGSVSPYEQQLITDINALIASIETNVMMERVSGQECVPTDTIQAKASLQTDMSDLISKVTQWQTNLTSTTAALALVAAADTDAGRLTAKNTEQSSVTTMQAAITTWLAYPTFNTGHGEVTCAGFYAHNAALLAPTKGYSTQLNTFKSAITTRSSQVTTRISQVSGYLGAVTQNLTTGDLTGGSGFYLERARYVNLRLHTMGGSLSALKGIDRSIASLGQFKKNTEDTLATYQLVMVASMLKAPANGTNKLHILSSTGLSIGNSIYIISDSQPELPLTIQAISGTMITVDKKIPQSYRENENCRVYREL
jgi:hypothetical protein